MARAETAEKIVRDMERLAPYMYEGLYGSFLRNFMEAEKSRWTRDLSTYLTNMNGEWEEVGEEIAGVLWERFLKRISC